MSNKWMLLHPLLLLGCADISQAHPLDGPDIVYIDGLPCNSACQSYMAWSRQKLTAGQPAPARDMRRLSETTVRHATRPHHASLTPAAPLARVAKQPAPSPATPAPVASTPAAKIATLQPADHAAPAPSEPARGNVAAAPDAAGAAATSTARPVRQQVAAAIELAEHVTAATTAPKSPPDGNAPGASAGNETTQPGDAAATAATASDDIDHLVAVLMARPDITSVSDLAGKTVAVEEPQATSSAAARVAMVAAGAADVELNAGNAKAVDRLINGEVPAAILALVSPEAADGFPDVAGYKIFRIPLSPRSLKARLNVQ
jgi:hypothetical protein